MLLRLQFKRRGNGAINVYVCTERSATCKKLPGKMGNVSQVGSPNLGTSTFFFLSLSNFTPATATDCSDITAACATLREYARDIRYSVCRPQFAS